MTPAAEEHDDRQAEAKASVQVDTDSKGFAKIRVKAYEGCEAAELRRLRELVIGEYLEARKAVA